MNVSRIQSCYPSQATRKWVRPSGDSNRARFSDAMVDVRTDGSSPTLPAYAPSSIESPVQPPWRVLSWPTAVRPVKLHETVAASVVKAPVGSADLNSVGRTLDLFV